MKEDDDIIISNGVFGFKARISHVGRRKIIARPRGNWKPEDEFVINQLVSTEDGTRQFAVKSVSPTTIFLIPMKPEGEAS